MRIALRQEVSSPESRFLIQILSKFGEVDILDPWDVRNVTETYDLAVGAGPVTSCPQAENKILFVLGPVENHWSHHWSTIIATSHGAAVNLFRHASKILIHPMPLLEMEVGQRRLLKEDKSIITLGSYNQDCDYQMSSWKLPQTIFQVPFSAMEFNSRCLNGAVGKYLEWYNDGYDIQVRKHLALGSLVCCPKNRDIIGDLVDYIIDEEDLTSGRYKEMTQEPIEDKVSKSDYVTAIEDIIRRI